MANPLPALRRTRFVCVSDTHNATPAGAFKLPKGDVLIHAGDMTNQGSFKELQKTVKWIEEADFETKIVIAGNHDITLDTDFYAQHGMYFHNQDPQDPAKCQELLNQSSSILWLKHEAAVVNLSSSSGPRTTFKIFGSPFSPAKGMWAFGYGVEAASNLWDRIPLDTDIVVTHTPPKYHCDETRERRSAGCESLRNALWRVRPRLAICGHVHEGRGVERVRWDLGTSNVQYKEIGVERWEDPGRDNKKMSSVDLTAKGRNPVDNDGSIGDCYVDSGNLGNTQDPTSSLLEHRVIGASPTTTNSLLSTNSVSVAMKGQGGVPLSQRCDNQALSGRMGRRETCVVNAAIMASSWPRGLGGKRFNKPIVVDIDLPVWQE